MAFADDGNRTSLRRLPIFFVIDCSGTMLGEKIGSVKRGVAEICETLNRDPRCRNTVYISVIWFNDAAYQTPLVPIGLFSLPDDLQVLGKTALGAGLRKLNGALDGVSNPLAPEAAYALQPGDFLPLVFLMSDGQPTDVWESEAHRLLTRTIHKPLHVIGLAIGNDADTDILGRVADVVLKIDTDFTQRLGDYFDWVSESVVMTQEQQQHSSVTRETLRLPPLPQTISRALKPS